MFAFKSPLALLPVIFSPLSPVLAQPVDEAIAQRSTSNNDSATMTVFYVTPNPSTCDTTFPSFSLELGVVSIIDSLDACNTKFYAQRDIWGILIPEDFIQAAAALAHNNNNCPNGLEIVSYNDCSDCSCDGYLTTEVFSPRLHSPTSICIQFDASQKSYMSHCIKAAST